ncbi:putative glycosyl transferase [Calothrix sp. NIES-4071]|nr:putative glycosyl transferase [Calothrix sp. NIES-4071]BAZ58139.1 putative glycosyl transferase [Calothrix sp. NIES-4105]
MLTSNFLFSITNILLIISLLLALPIVVLFVECMAALLPERNYSLKNQELDVCVVIPAHNEALCIGSTLASIHRTSTINEKILVVADNCTDNTADIARSCGATVIERCDLQNTGKGYALDFGFKYLKANPPDVVVVIDADCTVHSGTIERLAAMTVETNRPVQAKNLLKAPEHFTPRHAVSVLAFLVKNLVRQRGCSKLGVPASLTGTGMAFPWSLITKVGFASGNIAEDKQIGLDFAVAGYTPIFCEDALVTGYFPKHKQAGNSQRTRWVHGHLQTLLTQVPKLFLAAIRQKRFDLIAIALDLSVLPVSLLVILWFVSFSLALSISTLLGIWLPMLILSVEGLCIIIAITSAWFKFGRSALPTRSLLTIPFYMIWNLSIYLSFLIKPQKTWVRTERDS